MRQSRGPEQGEACVVYFSLVGDILGAGVWMSRWPELVGGWVGGKGVRVRDATYKTSRCCVCCGCSSPSS